MKPWTDLNLISKPPNIAALPVDARGYPVPFFAMWIDGKPDFRVVNPQAVFECATAHKCFVCGQKMKGMFTFVGGPKSMEHHHFTDGPTHKDCAEYALQTCPFLAIPTFAYNRAPILNAVVNEIVTTERQEKIGQGLTAEFTMVSQRGHVLFQAGRWLQLKWWQEGKELL